MSCPPKYAEFLSHLFPDEECRIFVLNYLHLMLTTRNGNNTALTMVGAKGIGKGIFVEMVAALVGVENFRKAHRNFWSSNFNAILKNCQVVYIDEQPINTPDKLDKFKDYCNNYHNIEKKGIDAVNQIETYFQMFVSVNREVDLKVEQDDRRMSIPEMTSTRLLDVWTEEEVDDFVNSFKDVKVIGQFGRYILEECKTGQYTTESYWHDRKYRKLVRVSLWEWQKFILDTVLDKKDDFYNLDKLKLEYKQIRSSSQSNINRDLVSDFLNNYLHEGERLGRITRDEDKRWGITPSPSFMPEKESFREIGL